MISAAKRKSWKSFQIVPSSWSTATYSHATREFCCWHLTLQCSVIFWNASIHKRIAPERTSWWRSENTIAQLYQLFPKNRFKTKFFEKSQRREVAWIKICKSRKTIPELWLIKPVVLWPLSKANAGMGKNPFAKFNICCKHIFWCTFALCKRAGIPSANCTAMSGNFGKTLIGTKPRSQIIKDYSFGIYQAWQ